MDRAEVEGSNKLLYAYAQFLSSGGGTSIVEWVGGWVGGRVTYLLRISINPPPDGWEHEVISNAPVFSYTHGIGRFLAGGGLQDGHYVERGGGVGGEREVQTALGSVWERWVGRWVGG